MKNFTPGQKVVFSLERLRMPREIYQSLQPWLKMPEEGEVLTVCCAHCDRPGFWILFEKPVSYRGTMQAISDLVLFPVDEINARYTEKLLDELEKSIYKIPAKTPQTI